MIVYGSASRCLSLASLLADVTAPLQVPSPSLDDIRQSLIVCGQLEQAVADAAASLGMAELRVRAERLTDAMAAKFVREWYGEQPLANGHDAMQTVLQDLGETVERVGSGRLLNASVPEGFAYYSLFPEQYIEAAHRWVQSEPRSGKALVVGVRSIGTTLSGVVREVLRHHGVDARRVTVRPSGHPYNRAVEIHADLSDIKCALIVDEGPGASGSSMAACAEALAACGLAPSRISFLPGHNGMPGHAASEAVLRWWRNTQRFAASLPEMRWRGRSLPEALADCCADLGLPSVVETVDVGGGLWRHAAYSDSGDYPAAALPFERTKYLCRCMTGYGPVSALWKFAGLPAGEDVRRMEMLARRGWTPPPLGTRMGFIARRWIEGRPLRRADLNATISRMLGRYAAEASLPAVSPEETQAALVRLREMVRVNVAEGLGDPYAHAALDLAHSVPENQWPGVCGYGDGRMDPHDWIRDAAGRIHKTDCAGHDRDHTCVGGQPVWWDLAGASIEWEMDGSLEAAMLDEFNRAGGPPPSPDVLRFYKVAYAAFRMGLSRFCADTLPQTESELNERDFARYRCRLRKLLQIAH